MTEMIQERTISSLRALRLETAAIELPSVLADANMRSKSALEVVDQLMAQELAVRQERGLHARMRLAHFPKTQTLDSFDFDAQPSVDRATINELSTMAFLERSEGVALVGPPGVGKTHLAIGLGVRAVQLGYRTYFTSAQDLLHAIQSARLDGIPGHRQKHLTTIPLLIIDELGYVEFDKAASTWLFQLLCQRYERHSTIITSNKSFSQWSEIFGEDMMASALLDRFLHHCHVLNIRGDSYRMKKRAQGTRSTKTKPGTRVGSP